MVLLNLAFTETTVPGPVRLGSSLQQLAARQWHGAVNRFLGPPRVGLQVGHEGSQDHPEELASLRISTGGHWRGVDEVDVNRQVATVLATMLEAHGIVVDVLPATVPPGYHADLVVSIHADSSPDPSRRGYKSAHYDPPRNHLEPVLKTHIDEAYFLASSLPDDHLNVSSNMFHYYAFNNPTYQHTIHPGTPAVIVELGYISHPDDLRFMHTVERPAAALRNGIVRYLQERGRLPRE
jgi:N-acetylmuramoyl-L-alanine amidase